MEIITKNLVYLYAFEYIPKYLLYIFNLDKNILAGKVAGLHHNLNCTQVYVEFVFISGK